VKASSRVLLGFGIAIAVLVITTIILVFSLGQGNAPPLPEDTPQGTVQRYLRAVQEKNYVQAYTYIAPPVAATDNFKPSPPQAFDFWLQSAKNNANSTWKATLGNTIVTGNNASVEVIVEVFRPVGPFENPVHSNNITFFMTKEGPGWKITSPTDLYWLY
jgi:hypothetical protein